jgi:hypothetical protein
MSPVDLKLGHVVCEAGGKLGHAYFPQDAVLSLLTVMEDGSSIETANIGREGAFGIFAAMYSRMTELLSGEWPINEFYELQPQHMGISGAARKLWIESHDQIERSISSELKPVRSLASKAA